MEACDVLADHVHVAGQRLLKAFVVGAVADPGDVVEQGVEPDVDRLGGIERNRDPPGKPFAGDGDVLELGFDQVDDFVAPACGLNEFRVRRVVCQQTVAIGRKPEEIVFFLDPRERRAGVVRAAPAPFLDFLLGLERFAAGAVMAGVYSLVDVARVEDGLDELLAAAMMPFFARLDEVVVRDIEGTPDVLKLAGHLIDVLLGLEPHLAGALRHLDGVFVVAHQEMDGVAFHAAESGLHVGADLLESGPDMRPAVGIVDRRRDVDSAIGCPSSLPRSPPGLLKS